MIYLSSNSGELFKQVLLLNPLDMFALANLLCPSLALPPFRARPDEVFPFRSLPGFVFLKGAGNGEWMDGCPKKLCANCMGMGELASWLRSNVPQQGKFPSSRCAFFFLIGNPLRNSCTNFGFPEASLCSEVNSALVITNAV